MHDTKLAAKNKNIDINVVRQKGRQFFFFLKNILRCSVTTNKLL